MRMLASICDIPAINHRLCFQVNRYKDDITKTCPFCQQDVQPFLKEVLLHSRTPLPSDGWVPPMVPTASWLCLWGLLEQ
ncbi:hypothetical protein ACOMHN_002025 [Nucella lapillus]